MQRIEKELASLGVYGRWLSEDVLVWETSKPSKKIKKTATIPSDESNDDFYAGISCRVCGNPVEKTGRKGRPPTKCIQHR